MSVTQGMVPGCLQLPGLHKHSHVGKGTGCFSLFGGGRREEGEEAESITGPVQLTKVNMRQIPVDGTRQAGRVWKTPVPNDCTQSRPYNEARPQTCQYRRALKQELQQKTLD